MRKDIKIEKMPKPYRGYKGYAISIKLKDLKGDGLDDITDASEEMGIPVVIHYKKSPLMLLTKEVCTKLFGADVTEEMFSETETGIGGSDEQTRS